jgi:hypothetical protein
MVQEQWSVISLALLGLCDLLIAKSVHNPVYVDQRCLVSQFGFDLAVDRLSTGGAVRASDEQVWAVSPSPFLFDH